MFAVLLLCTVSDALAEVSNDEIISRVRDTYGVVPSSETVAQYLSTQSSDGSWPEFDYNDHSQTMWPLNTVVNRINSLAMAYTATTSSYCGDSDVYDAVYNALAHWEDKRPYSSNWYYNQLYVPEVMCRTLLYMKDGLQQLPHLLENKYMTWYDTLPEPDYHDFGANRIGVAKWHLWQGLIRDSSSEIAYGADGCFNSLAYTTAEGFQHDHTYMDHGPQVYIYGYGSVAVDWINKIALILVGSPYELPQGYLGVYSNFLRGGLSKVRRGAGISFNVNGRGISRPGNLEGNVSYLYGPAKILDPNFADAYQAIGDRSSGSLPPGDGIVPDHTHFYRAKLTTHTRSGYNISIVTNSVRTHKQEKGNGENLKGKFLSEGSSNIHVHGDEYYNIPPVWDWTKIPGTTVPQHTDTEPPADWGVMGTSTFTGGVSTSRYGAVVFAMDEYNTQIKKAWFCFDEEVVCLGTGLNSTDAEVVSTTVNQANLSGAVTVSQSSVISDLPADTNSLYTDTLDWVLHDSVGYFFPQGGDLNLSNQSQSGSWYDINHNQSPDIITSDVFKLWFAHGLHPVDETYAYIIAPGKTTAAEMQAYDLSNISILSNTPTVQAVRHEALDMIQVVFYAPDELTANGTTIRVDCPCVMVLSNVSTANIGVHIADPAEAHQTIRVRWESPAIVGLREIACAMPSTESTKGATVEYEINTNTSVPKPFLTSEASEDAYVRGGNYADQAYPDGLLVVKTAQDPSYVRRAFLKFDLNDFPNTNGIAKIGLTVTGAANDFDVFFVSDDSWTQDTLIWNTQPEATTYIGRRSSSVPDVPTVLEWDITSQFLAEKAGDKEISIEVVGVVDQAYSTIFSCEDPDELNRPIIEFTPSGDLDMDNDVDMDDLMKLALNWLNPYDLKDFSYVSYYWLED